jgi:hypothetical protein
MNNLFTGVSNRRVQQHYSLVPRPESNEVGVFGASRPSLCDSGVDAFVRERNEPLKTPFGAIGYGSQS